MKNLKNIAIVALILMLIMSATSTGQSLLTFKPAKPESTVVVTDGNWTPWIKQGYQITAISGGTNQYVIVMERYK